VPAYLDALIDDRHLARLIWRVVERLDLSACAEGLVVVEGGPGRSAADPQILVGLWLYATSQGVTSARALERLCVAHVAYIWLCGGISMNYHTLSDFRTAHGEALTAIMTEVLGHLRAAGLIRFEHVAQDGVRVRASAGAASFRRQPTLEQGLSQARAFVEKVARGEGEHEALSRGERAAQHRAAREQVDRLEAALAQMPSARAAKKRGEEAKARVSTTDPEARVMKMPDGGFRPAYNIQLAADTAHQVIVGVDVTNEGSDMGQAPGMVEQVEQRTGELPAQWLMDGGFAKKASIEAVEAKGPEVVAPVQVPKDPDRDPHEPTAKDSATIAAWRVRMASDAAKQTYKLRASTIECVNAKARAHHGLQQVRVRGVAKVLCVALWMAIAHNILILVRTGATHAPVQPAATS
jgi:transposase